MNAPATFPTSPKPAAADLDIAILGAGFSGLGMAIRLKQEGRHSFAVFEKAGEVGGTWRENTYPGCACDVPSHLYSFSFAPNPDWTRAYATQPEIQAYLVRCTDTYGLRPFIRFNTRVAQIAWDNAQSLWRITAGDGTVTTARAVASGMGGLHVPAFPTLKGMDSFAGVAFHSAEWRHDVDLTGKRVAVIGTGASAIQFVPRIAPEIAQLTLFQRTPPWVMPKLDRDIPDAERTTHRRFPLVQKLKRARIYVRNEILALGFLNAKKMGQASKFALDHINRQIADPALRAKVTPDYTVGCKRVLISNDYYPALARPNVDLVTDAIREITPTGLVTADGEVHDVDVIIYATGFKPFDIHASAQVIGRNGAKMDQAWANNPGTLLGITAAGFPNYFFLMGPNTGLGHNSMIYMIESQIAYVLDALKLIERESRAGAAAVLEPTPAAQSAFQQELLDKARSSVWRSGCKSWYVNAEGRNTTIWPDFTFRYRRRTKRIAKDQYTVRVVGAPVS